MIKLARRSFIINMGASIITAPAIVRASSLMAIKPIERLTTADDLYAEWQVGYMRASIWMMRDIVQPVGFLPNGFLDELDTKMAARYLAGTPLGAKCS